MSVNNRYTVEEFDSIINIIESIKDVKERLKYIDSVKQKYSDIFFPKKKIRLLSSENLKRLEDKLKKINKYQKEANDIVNEMRAEENKNSSKPRDEDDYIKWNGKLKQLRDLLIKLIKEGYIIVEKEVNIDKLIDEHFYIEDYSVPKDGKIKSIKWNKPKPDLMHLFEKLLINDLLAHFKKKRHEILASHFMNIDNINYDADELSKEYYKYKKKVYKNKDRFEQLNDIIEGLFLNS